MNEAERLALLEDLDRRVARGDLMFAEAAGLWLQAFPVAEAPERVEDVLRALRSNLRRLTEGA